MRAIVPSSFMISQITPAEESPARLARSTEPSVCPVRCSTPPGFARSGKMCPGLTMSLGLASARTAVSTVCARSAALMPVVTPSAASIEMVKAVEREERFPSTIIGRSSCATRSSVSARQMRPRP